jgi:DNA-binding NarL/FixJ family response regulator
MKVVIADDHPLVRDALARVIRQLELATCVTSVADYDALIGVLAQALPDLLIVDLNMPGMEGLEALRLLRERFPSLLLVVVSGQDDPATIRSALAAGANGFIPKSDPPEVLMQALRLVRAGGAYVPSRALVGLDKPGGPPADVADLTPRQRDVLRLLLHGEPNKVIARQLDLTEGTVKVHIAAILRTLQVRNRTEAVVRARELGFPDAK